MISTCPFLAVREGRKVPNIVWSSSSSVHTAEGQGDSQAEESWAVSKHGTLHAAYSNPRVGVPKVEEWGRLRPSQAGISAWTLSLKRQLLDEQLEEHRLR